MNKYAKQRMLEKIWDRLKEDKKIGENQETVKGRADGKESIGGLIRLISCSIQLKEQLSRIKPGAKKIIWSILAEYRMKKDWTH